MEILSTIILSSFKVIFLSVQQSLQCEDLLHEMKLVMRIATGADQSYHSAS